MRSDPMCTPQTYPSIVFWGLRRGPAYFCSMRQLCTYEPPFVQPRQPELIRFDGYSHPIRAHGKESQKEPIG